MGRKLIYTIMETSKTNQTVSIESQTEMIRKTRIAIEMRTMIFAIINDMGCTFAHKSARGTPSAQAPSINTSTRPHFAQTQVALPT